MEEFSTALVAIVAVLLFTAFVKIFTALNILRYGLGLHGGGFGVVIGAVALALSWVVMAPLLSPDQALPASAYSAADRFRPFMTQHSDSELVDRLSEFHARRLSEAAQKTPDGGTVSVPRNENAREGTPAAATHIPTEVLVPAFLLSELRDAFVMGLIALLPFVVIDLLVVHLLMLLNVTQLAPHVVALPLKLLLFVAVDGWALFSEKLLSGYVGG